MRFVNGWAVTKGGSAWVSDHIGRENTMFVAFGLEGLGILLLINFAHVPVLFIVFSGPIMRASGSPTKLTEPWSGGSLPGASLLSRAPRLRRARLGDL